MLHAWHWTRRNFSRSRGSSLCACSSHGYKQVNIAQQFEIATCKAADKLRAAVLGCHRVCCTCLHSLRMHPHHICRKPRLISKWPHAADLPCILACVLSHGTVASDQLHGLRSVSKAWLAAVNSATRSATLHVTSAGALHDLLDLRHLTLQGKQTVEALLRSAHQTAHARAASKLRTQSQLLSAFSGQQLLRLTSLQLHDCDSILFRCLTRAAEQCAAVAQPAHAAPALLLVGLHMPLAATAVSPAGVATRQLLHL